MKSQISKLMGDDLSVKQITGNGEKTKGLFARYAKEAIADGVKTTMVQCSCCTRMVPGVIVDTGGVKDSIPLHMPCNTCEKWLGHLEVDNLKILDGMCLECFTEETDQWDSK